MCCYHSPGAWGVCHNDRMTDWRVLMGSGRICQLTTLLVSTVLLIGCSTQPPTTSPDDDSLSNTNSQNDNDPVDSSDQDNGNENENDQPNANANASDEPDPIDEPDPNDEAPLTPSADAFSDFSATDSNPASLRFQEGVSPRDYLGGVSAWYFGHST